MTTIAENSGDSRPTGVNTADMAVEDLTGLGREAASRGDWQVSYDLLTEADARTPLTTEFLPVLADAAYATGDLDTTITAWERVYDLSLQAGANLEAGGAAVRVAMHLLFDTALMAPVRGWLKRAEQLLEGQIEVPAVAWLAVIKNYERLLSGDFPEARLWARRAIDVGMRCAPAAAAIGRVAEARSLILEGAGAQGLALLNDAGVAALSGELDPISTGVVYCELVCAMQGLAQYDLAEQWTEAMERWHLEQPVGSIHGRCRVHRAEILRLRGSNREAEEEVLRACEELRPYLRRELGWPLAELGRIRLRRGDISGAEEAFLSAHAASWDPQPGLALVYLAQGKIGRAADCIREALEHPSRIPSKELPPSTELRRAPLLEAQVEIEVAGGDIKRARAAAEELARIADSFESRALGAGAALASGRVSRAEGDLPLARRYLEEALSGWNEVGAPYEAAVARLELGQVYRAEGSEERALLEFRAARLAFEQIGSQDKVALAARATGEPVRAISAVQDSRASMPNGANAYEHIFLREGDYWSLSFEGATIRLRDLKGLRYLARLLAAPGQEIHALSLVAQEGSPQAAGAGSGMSGPAGRDAGPFLDVQAKESYRRRLAEIEDDIEEAKAMGDGERVFQAESEREFLAHEIARAVGLGGRDRRANSASERARVSVTRALRQAMERIREHNQPLGEHLDRAIRTGTYCSYLPDTRLNTRWNIGR